MFCADDGRKTTPIVALLCNEITPSPWPSPSLNAKWLLVCWSFLPCAMDGTGGTSIAVNGGDTEETRFEIEPMPAMTFSCGCDNLV